MIIAYATETRSTLEVEYQLTLSEAWFARHREQAQGHAAQNCRDLCGHDVLAVGDA